MDALNVIAPVIDVHGQTIAMTGGATGLGRAVFESLIDQGAGKVVVIDIREDELAKLKAQYGDKVETISFNLAQSDDAAYDELANKIIESAGDRLDVFLGNAGILKATSLMPYEATKDYTLKEIFMSFTINAAANIALFQRLKPILEQSAGRFVFTTSPTAGRTSDTKYPWYGSAKAYQEQAMGCVATGNPEVPVIAFDPGRLDATGVRAEAYPNEVPGAQPASPDILEPLLRIMSKEANIAALQGQAIQVNNVEDKDIKGRKINKRSVDSEGREGFDIIVKSRPLASVPGTGTVIGEYNTAGSRAAINAPALEPYDPDGKTLGEIFGLPSQQIGNKLNSGPK